MKLSVHCLACVIATLSERLPVCTAYVSAAAHALSPACRSSYLFREVWSSGEGLWSEHETSSQEDVHTRINSLSDLGKPFFFTSLVIFMLPHLLFETRLSSDSISKSQRTREKEKT